MPAERLLLLGGALLSCTAAAAQTVPAAAVPVPHPVATPVGSPADWIAPNDYPPAALRHQMTGTTGFRLTVAIDGKPIRCDITTSSGFELLDTATCDRLMLNARFAPPRDSAGKPIETFYSNRVRWVVPAGPRRPVTERYLSVHMSIDAAGTVTSCRSVAHMPESTVADGDCSSFPPSDLVATLRRLQPGAGEWEMRTALGFTLALRERVLAARLGYEQRGLHVHRFSVGSDGKPSACSYEEQRGGNELDFCGGIQGQTFDPPFAAVSKDGTAIGWNIIRLLVKPGQ